MKTDYKILWIDDDHRYLRGDRRNIRNFLDGYGINLTIEEVTVTTEECPTRQETFAQAVSDINLDMVFVDFNMPEQGDTIIQHIRKDLHHYHLPILFYTNSQNAESSLQNSILTLNGTVANIQNVADGIYYCDSDHIYEKAKLILTSLLKKESRPQQSRGLLMDRVSEIDAKMIQSIHALWLDVPEEKRPKVQKELQSRLDSGLKRTCALRKELRGMEYEEIITSLDLSKLDTFTRAKVLREMLRSIVDLKSNGDVLSKFCQGDANLNDLRNDYAHKTSSQIEADHDDERCKYIRTETRAHLENLDYILKNEHE